MWISCVSQCDRLCVNGNRTEPGCLPHQGLLSCTQAEVQLVQRWCLRQVQHQSSICKGYKENQREMDLPTPARCTWSSLLDQRGSLASLHLQHHTQRTIIIRMRTTQRYCDILSLFFSEHFDFILLHMVTLHIKKLLTELGAFVFSSSCNLQCFKNEAYVKCQWRQYLNWPLEATDSSSKFNFIDPTLINIFTAWYKNGFGLYNCIFMTNVQREKCK